MAGLVLFWPSGVVLFKWCSLGVMHHLKSLVERESVGLVIVVSTDSESASIF